MQNVSRSCFSIVLLSILPLIACSGQAQVKAKKQSLEKETSLRDFLQKFDDDRTTRYSAAFRDLNGDGTPEAIVHLISNGWCGSGGCNTLVLAHEDSGWRIVANITVTRLPIRVLADTSHGWHDIGVWVQGGGVQRGYEADLPFDGKTYPQNPTLPPARQSSTQISGAIIIASSEVGIPLYTSPNNLVSPPSFNCASAKTATEKLICRDADLSAMDSKMGRAYRDLVARLQGNQAVALRREQLEWLTEYSRACNAVASETERKGCITRFLSARVKQIQAH
jgi:uncharacterized protein YecT (DUF1311 family)